MAKFVTNGLVAMQVAPNLEPMQVEFFLAGEITQVKESIAIPCVRCASGNIFFKMMTSLNSMTVLRCQCLTERALEVGELRASSSQLKMSSLRLSR